MRHVSLILFYGGDIILYENKCNSCMGKVKLNRCLVNT